MTKPKSRPTNMRLESPTLVSRLRLQGREYGHHVLLWNASADEDHRIRPHK